MIPLLTHRPTEAAVQLIGRLPLAELFTSARARRRSVSVTRAWLVLWMFCALVALPGLSFAGTGGTEFAPAYTTISTWLQGDLGRLIAVALLIVGLVMGVVRQSIMAAVPAVACGLVATVAPTIIGAVVTAVI